MTKRFPKKILLTASLSLLSLKAAAVTNVEAPIALGMAVAQTSNVALLGQEQIQGAKIAEEYFNSKGGINGVPVKLLVEDTGGDEMGAINTFNRLIGKSVLGIVGPTLSQQAFSADPLAERSKVPVLAPSNTAKGIPQIGQYIARVSAPIAIVAPKAIKAALDIDPKIKKVAVFYAQNDAFSVSETGTFQETIKKQNLEVITTQKFQTTDTDFTTQVTSALALKPELIVISGLAADSGNLIKQLKQMGFKGVIVGGNGLNTNNIFPICQKYCDGIVIAQAYSPEVKSEINTAFIDLYNKKHGKIPLQIAAQAFTAVQVFVEALKEVDKKSKITGASLPQVRIDLNKQILAGKYFTPLGEIAFDKDGEIVQKDFYVARVTMNADGKNGTFTFLK